MGFRVEVLGVKGLRFRGFRVEGFGGLEVWEFRVKGFGV